MDVRHQKFIDRLSELIAEGERVAGLERPSDYGGAYIQEPAPLHAWLVRVENIVDSVFGAGSAHRRQLSKALASHVERAYEVNRIVGILQGALSDLEGGFLASQEQLLAAAIFDDVLDEAQHIAEAGYKDPAAMLVRVVVEDTLRRLSRELDLDDSRTASVLNDGLRDVARYPKPRWRTVQSWLDIGNAAAHGQFDEYTRSEVSEMIDDVRRFLADTAGA